MGKTSRSIVAVLVLALVALVPGVARAQADGCADGGGGSLDIESLQAWSEWGWSYPPDWREPGSSGASRARWVVVELTLCAGADLDLDGRPDAGTYRVHFDHTAPFPTDADRDGDGRVRKADFCAPTVDDTMLLGRLGATGPGQIDLDGNRVTYRVPMSDLSPDLQEGNTIFVWADTQRPTPMSTSKRLVIADRAPNTDASDGCGEPQVDGEFVALVLEDRWTDYEWPCQERYSRTQCRPETDAGCLLGSGPCECKWEAVFLEPISGSNVCARPDGGRGYDFCDSCPSTEPCGFCKPIPCEERQFKSQCRPDDCFADDALNPCVCTWDAHDVDAGGTENCPGINEDDPCLIQAPGSTADPFCRSVP